MLDWFVITRQMLFVCCGAGTWKVVDDLINNVTEMLSEGQTTLDGWFVTIRDECHRHYRTSIIPPLPKRRKETKKSILSSLVFFSLNCPNILLWHYACLHGSPTTDGKIHIKTSQNFAITSCCLVRPAQQQSTTVLKTAAKYDCDYIICEEVAIRISVA